MKRFSALVIALAYTVSTFGVLTAPSPAQAGTTANHYVATLAAPASDNRIIAKNTVWSCEGTTCVAAESNSRPVRVCRDLQRKVGTIATFSAEGEALEASDLARCNG